MSVQNASFARVALYVVSTIAAPCDQVRAVSRRAVSGIWGSDFHLSQNDSPSSAAFLANLADGAARKLCRLRRGIPGFDGLPQVLDIHHGPFFAGVGIISDVSIPLGSFSALDRLEPTCNVWASAVRLRFTVRDPPCRGWLIAARLSANGCER
jgi:hypothetical protein